MNTLFEPKKGDLTDAPMRGGGRQPSFNWTTLLWVLLAWFILAPVFRSLSPTSPSGEISYTEFKQQVSGGNVAEVTLKGNHISGKFRAAENGSTADSQGQSAEGQEADNGGGRPFFSFFRSDDAGSQPQHFRTIKPDVSDKRLLPLLEQNDVTVRAESQEQPWIWTLMISLLPWVLIFGLFYYASRKMQERMGTGGPGGGIFGFAKSKAKLYSQSKSETTYEDVAGLDNAKKELQEVVAYLKDPSRFQKLGGELPNGILLAGPPGVGKTLLAQATAGEAGVPFFSISGSEFIEMFVGVGASRVRDMFKKAKKEAPAIIFIDELDSIGRTRGTGLGGGHDEREQTLNQILSEMDGFEKHQSLIVLAATNRPDVLDPALIRPGRFDRRITLDMPQKNARKKILYIHTREVPLDDEVDLKKLAERTVGLSGADLKNLVNEAALMAARKEKHRVGAADFDQARDKILMGIEREDMIDDDEKEMVAWHEAGHALLAELLPGADSLQKVTIIPRGQALGATEQIPDEERLNLKRSYLLNRISILLGGRVAEKIVFEDLSTGAADDLKKATQLARRMVCQWGMSEKLGPVTFSRGEAHPFLGRELTEEKDFSDQTARLIDEEISKIVGGMEQKAHEILSANRKQLDALAAELLDKEVLYRNDIDQVLRKANGSGR
jgi:cell division protease FtsH